VSERGTDENDDTPTDPSIEFDILEMARLRLVEALMSAGRPALEAERIALYVVEGLRNVPRLLKVLTGVQSPSPAEILDTLGPVLDQAFALEKARYLLREARPTGTRC
jgi:hypothetical protein